MFAHLNPHSSDFRWRLGCTHAMQARTCVSAGVCGACNLRLYLSYSRHRNRINLGFLRGVDRGAGGGRAGIPSRPCGKRSPWGASWLTGNHKGPHVLWTANQNPRSLRGPPAGSRQRRSIQPGSVWDWHGRKTGDRGRRRCTRWTSRWSRSPRDGEEGVTGIFSNRRGRTVAPQHPFTACSGS